MSERKLTFKNGATWTFHGGESAEEVLSAPDLGMWVEIDREFLFTTTDEVTGEPIAIPEADTEFGREC